MWSICLCHKSMSDLTFCPFANIRAPIPFVSRINILPCLCPLCPHTINRPSSSMKLLLWLNRTYMPWSTICPLETKFFAIVRTCNTFHINPFYLTWLSGTSPTTTFAILVFPSFRPIPHGLLYDLTFQNQWKRPLLLLWSVLPSSYLLCASLRVWGSSRPNLLFRCSVIGEAYLHHPGCILLSPNPHASSNTHSLNGLSYHSTSIPYRLSIAGFWSRLDSP